jgi:hypothetical protein
MYYPRCITEDGLPMMISHDGLQGHLWDAEKKDWEDALQKCINSTVKTKRHGV